MSIQPIYLQILRRQCCIMPGLLSKLSPWKKLVSKTGIAKNCNIFNSQKFYKETKLLKLRNIFCQIWGGVYEAGRSLGVEDQECRRERLRSFWMSGEHFYQRCMFVYLGRFFLLRIFSFFPALFLHQTRKKIFYILIRVFFPRKMKTYVWKHETNTLIYSFSSPIL